MSKTIRNIWNEANIDLDTNIITPFNILQEQAKAINRDVDKTNIIGVVMTLTVSTNEQIKEVKHVLYLFPKNGNDYNYRFIELECKPDRDYLLKVYAYQSGNVNFGECKDEDELYETLRKIFRDPRLRIVFEQLKNIGNTIESWRKDKD